MFKKVREILELGETNFTHLTKAGGWYGSSFNGISTLCMLFNVKIILLEEW